MIIQKIPKKLKILPKYQNINVNNRNKTPKKELKSLNFNFSQVLTNIRDSEQNSIFNNTNGLIIKEEKKKKQKELIKKRKKIIGIYHQ